MDSIFQSIAQNPGASTEMRDDCEKRLGCTLPADYKQFMGSSNGCEGFVGADSYAILWRIEDLNRLNLAYEVETYAPRCLLFASDGGGEAYGFDLRGQQVKVVRIPFVGMSWNTAVTMSKTFTDWVSELAKACR